MNHEIQDLARRAVACKHWRWMPGMRAVDGAERFRVSVVSHGYPQGVDEEQPMKVNVDLGLRWFPDLTDPATLGCLLALVREAWGDEWLACKGDYSPHSSTWVVYSGKPHGRGFLTQVAGTRYSFEAEALVAALEAAP